MRRRRNWILAAVAALVIGAAAVGLHPDTRAFALKTVDRVVYRVHDRLDPARPVSEIWTRLSDPTTALVLGTPDAPESAVFVIFVDYNCVHCRRQFQELAALSGSGVRFRAVLRHKPHRPDSVALAKALLAARLQNGGAALHRVLAAADRRLGPDDLPDLAVAAGLDPTRLLADAARPEIEAQLEDDLGMAWNLRIKSTPITVTPTETYRGVRMADELSLMFAEPTATQGRAGMNKPGAAPSP